MKKLSLFLQPLVFIIGAFFLLPSCQKINEATELGGGLVPEVDNVKTFETTFDTQTDNGLLNDTAKLGYSDLAALGHISNDPEFGKTTANLYFDISSPSYGTNPFSSKENLVIDSVVLSLGYVNTYGDTNTLQSVRVFELPQSSSFVDTVLYPFNQPDFETGAQIGRASFVPKDLNDTITLIRRDTAKTANVLRIRLDEELGYRFAAFDSTRTFNGGFYSDSLFKTLFKGLAVKADEGIGNALSYFNLADAAKTNLIVYYRATRGTIKDTATLVFTHSTNGQANTIRRTAAGNYATALSNGTAQDQLVYIQSAPGSFASIKIPSLDTFRNNVIHRAELIVTRVPSTLDAIFTPPAQLFLDKINTRGDSAITFYKDFPVIQGQQLNWQLFGGALESDRYFFNITQHVQDIVSRDSSNYVLRLYAPFETTLIGNSLRFLTIPVNVRAGEGRVVVGGGNHPDPAVRMRLRIVYSKL